MAAGVGQEVAPTSRFKRQLVHPEKSGRRESDSRYRGMSGRHRPRRLLAQNPSENSDSLDMSRVRDDSSEVRAWGGVVGGTSLTPGRNAQVRGMRGPDISRRKGERRAVGGTVRRSARSPRQFGAPR